MLLALREAKASLPRIPSMLCLCMLRERVGEGDSLFRKALAAVSHPLFHISSDTGFHDDHSWHWEGRSWAEPFPG